MGPVRLRLSEVAAATGGELTGPDVDADGAAIDSRLVSGGELFVAVQGERDGHEFVAAATAAGAAAALVSQTTADAPSAVLVPDTGAALLALGRHARTRLPDRVIGVTGSVGKTTVKDLLAGILRRRFETAASLRSFNNELGVPLTLLNAADGTEAAVVEMGARGIGHIALLCGIAHPTIGIVTTVNEVHTELFGTIEEVARGKGELVESLPATGTAVLHAERPLVRAMADRTSARVLLVGRNDGDVRADEVELDDELRPTFRLRTPWGDAEVHLGIRGDHQVDNALAATAAALAAGSTLDEVVAGLAEPETSPWRMELHRTPTGVSLLNDAYNANPTSTAAALRSLARLPASRRIAVLGTMAELGERGPEHHREIGRLAAELGIRVVAVAEPDYGAEDVPGVDAAADLLAGLGLGEGDAVLVKGSRVAGLERLAHRLLAPA